ncbi:zinc finger protein 578-like [Microplitis mediator]|uniref:zinc finger protein 578-like n=1 Tax=Microplitis mediator TaxID=375433 RepID=UPI00255674F1|nr:zinc finger protein 578-like [Microplitis mediator]
MNINNDIDAIKIEYNENSTILDLEYHETTVVDKKNMEDLDTKIINAPVVKDTMELFENNLNPQVDNNYNYCSVINLYESDLHPSNKTWITRNNSLSSVNSDQASLLTDDFFISTENEHHDKNYDLLSYIKITKVESLSGRNNSWTETVDENNNEEQNIIYDIKKENFDYNDKTDGSDKTIVEENQFKKCMDMAASSTLVKNISLADELLVSNDDLKNIRISSIETRISNQKQIKVEDNKNSFESSHHISNILNCFLPSVLLERIEVPGKVIETSNSVAKTNEIKLTETSFKSKTNKPVDSEKPLQNNKPYRVVGEQSCKECGYLALSKHELNRHEQKHSDEKPIQCPECPFKTPYKGNLTVHMRRVHSNQMVSTKLCDSKFMRANDLREQMRIHTAKDPITCHICKKTFGQRFRLKRHMISHSEERPHECNICHNKFKRADALTSHLETHLVDHTAYSEHTAKYQCKICLREFTRINYLNLHLRGHSDKRHKCEICKREFFHLHYLNQHTELHKPCPPGEVLKCQFCHESYNDQFSLRNHTKTHKQGKIYKCRICCYKTTESLGLIEHANDHTNNKLCICDKCGHSFEDKKYLRQHLIQDHLESKQASKRKRQKIN